MKIKSITDVITNSSSEVFTIKNTKGIENYKELWEIYITEKYKNDKFWEGLEYTYLGDDITEENGVITIKFGMCNLDERDLEFLRTLFGPENVETDNLYYFD